MKKKNQEALRQASVIITKADKIAGGVRRIWMEISGKKFRRLFETGLPPVWMDDLSNNTMAKHENEELEKIFKAWCLENNFDQHKLIDKSDK